MFEGWALPPCFYASLNLTRPRKEPGFSLNLEITMLRKLFLASLLALLAGPAFAASAYISEYAALGQTSSGTATAQIATLPPFVDQKVTFTGTPGSSAAFNAKTRFIRVHCDAACSISVSGTATTSNARIPTDGVEYFGVQPGAVLSVIANP